MRLLRAGLPMEVHDINELGFDGDMVEAQAFAYLAARVLHGLPTSFPLTTGVPSPVIGGKISAAS
jgi:anhydro-N-acetylmuramic acid kinase